MRDDRGRFTTGNCCGITTRFKLGTTGNPIGRPHGQAWHAQALAGAGHAELQRIAWNAAERPQRRLGAIQAMRRRGISIVSASAVPGATFDRTWRWRCRFASRRLAVTDLLDITNNLPGFYNPSKREAARQVILGIPRERQAVAQALRYQAVTPLEMDGNGSAQTRPGTPLKTDADRCDTTVTDQTVAHCRTQGAASDSEQAEAHCYEVGSAMPSESGGAPIQCLGDDERFTQNEKERETPLTGGTDR